MGMRRGVTRRAAGVGTCLLPFPSCWVGGFQPMLAVAFCFAAIHTDKKLMKALQYFALYKVVTCIADRSCS